MNKASSNLSKIAVLNEKVKTIHTNFEESRMVTNSIYFQILSCYLNILNENDYRLKEKFSKIRLDMLMIESIKQNNRMIKNSK